MTLPPADFAYSQYQYDEELERQKKIVHYRDLYDNYLPDSLVQELRASLLGGDATEIHGGFNYFETVIAEVADRLGVVDLVSERPSRDAQAVIQVTKAGAYQQGANGSEPPEDGREAPIGEMEEEIEPEQDNTVGWAMEWWQRHDMDEIQAELFEYTLVDGEAFIILQPEFVEHEVVDVVPYVHRVYTDAQAGGDNEGCKAHYSDGRLVMVSKRWIVAESSATLAERITGREGSKTNYVGYMTLYIVPVYGKDGSLEQGGEIRRYRRDGGADPSSSTSRTWEEIQEPESWEFPSPAIHFRAPKGQSRGKNAAGPQVLLSNYHVGLAVGTSIGTLPTLRVLGGYPTTDGKAPASDGSNIWRIGSGAILGFPDKSPEQASVDYVLPADMTQHVEAIMQATNHLSITTGTPTLMSQNIRADAAAELIRRIEGRPIAKARQCQVSLGNAFYRLFKALSVYLDEFTDFEVDDSEVFTLWQTADTSVTAIAGTEEKPVLSGYETKAIDQIQEVA